MLGSLSGWHLLLILFGFFVVAAIVIGVVLIIVFANRRPAVICPHCRSRINAQATVCAQCQREVTPLPPASDHAEPAPPPEPS